MVIRCRSMSLTSALLAPLLYAVSLAPRETDGCPGGMVFFEFDSARLEEQAVSVLDRTWVGWQPMVEAGAWINVDAGADDRGPASYNLRLSRRRAMAVRRYFEARGVSRGQIRIRALGESQPLAQFDGRHSVEMVRAQNRYVNLSIQMPLEIFYRFFPPEHGVIC